MEVSNFLTSEQLFVGLVFTLQGRSYRPPPAPPPPQCPYTDQGLEAAMSRIADAASAKSPGWHMVRLGCRFGLPLSVAWLRCILYNLVCEFLEKGC